MSHYKKNPTILHLELIIFRPQENGVFSAETVHYNRWMGARFVFDTRSTFPVIQIVRPLHQLSSETLGTIPEGGGGGGEVDAMTLSNTYVGTS